MVSYRLDGMPGVRTPSTNRSVPQPVRTIADYIAKTRMTANEYQHPVAVFDLAGQPVFRNSALATRLSSEQQTSSSGRIWQLVYATACRIVAESITGRTDVSTVIPVQQRSFVILGSLLRLASGTTYGVTVHIAEITDAAPEKAPVSFGAGSPDVRSSESVDDAYCSWVQRRDEARSRMQCLSPRETEVVVWVSAGLPNKSIARKLDISVKTIEKHRANAVRKLSVKTTPEMVRIAVLADVDNPATVTPPPPVSLLPGPTRLAHAGYVSGHGSVD